MPTLNDSSSLCDSRIIRPAELAEILGVSRVTLWRMRRRSELPEPLRVSAGAIGWRESTIRSWLDDQEMEAAGGGEEAK